MDPEAQAAVQGCRVAKYSEMWRDGVRLAGFAYISQWPDTNNGGIWVARGMLASVYRFYGSGSADGGVHGRRQTAYGSCGMRSRCLRYQCVTGERGSSLRVFSTSLRVVGWQTRRSTILLRFFPFHGHYPVTTRESPGHARQPRRV